MNQNQKGFEAKKRENIKKFLTLELPFACEEKNPAEVKL